MPKRIAIIGSPEDVQPQVALLQKNQLGCIAVNFTDPDKLISVRINEKVMALKITHVVCVGTKNGSTGFWALELSKKVRPCPHVCGIDIPPHPQNVPHAGMQKVEILSSLSDLFKAPVPVTSS